MATTMAATTRAGAPLLDRVVRVDAAVTGLLGVLVVVGAEQLAPHVGMGVSLVRGLGVVFVAVAALIAWRLSRGPLSRRFGLVLAVLGMDWAIASAVVLFAGVLNVTSLGWWVVLLQADVTALLAALQFYAAWRMRR